METTLESPVSTIAKEVLEDIKYGRKKIKFGSQIKTISQPKPKKNYFNKLIILIFLFIISVASVIEYSKCTITGFSASNGESILPNANLEFHNMNSNKVYYVKSSKEGDFRIRMDKGTYKVCSKDPNIQESYKDPKTSPIRVKIKESTNIRVGFNAIKGK
jgi:hypothetical protein